MSRCLGDEHGLELVEACGTDRGEQERDDEEHGAKRVESVSRGEYQKYAGGDGRHEQRRGERAVD